MRVAPGKRQVAQGFSVDGKEAAGGAVFRRHVADGGAVGQRQMIQAGAVKFHELADHALLAQHLGHGQHQIGRGCALAQLAAQPQAHHFGDQHRHRLAQHGGLGLDPAHAPAQHGQAVDHGGMAVGAHQRVGIGQRPARGVFVLDPDGFGQILQVDLVADAGARRHDPEVGEGLLAPAQKGVAFAVALELPADVGLEGARRAEFVDHDRVIDDQIHGGQRVDPARVVAQRRHGLAHGGQIDDGGHAGEVLHQHAGGAEGDFLIGPAPLQPGPDRLDVGHRHRLAVLEAQQVFQQHLERKRQAGEVADSARGFLQAEIVVGLAIDGQGLAGAERILAGAAHAAILHG